MRPGKGHHPRWGQILEEDDTIDSFRLLRVMYPQGPEHPAWAYTAYKFGWITMEQFLDAEPWDDAPMVGRISEAMYENNPFVAMLRK